MIKLLCFCNGHLHVGLVLKALTIMKKLPHNRVTIKLFPLLSLKGFHVANNYTVFISADLQSQYLSLECCSTQM